MRACLLLLLIASPLLADDSANLFADGKKPADRRLTTIRSLNDKDFNLKVPATLAAWQARRQAVREQILVSNGLWPLPPQPAIKPVIHGRIDREGYSVEKVYFASHPGHYVTGNLYRPRTKEGKLPEGKLPGVLCPHGHWRNGRFYDAGEAAGKAQIAKKAEKTIEGARYPLQARCAQLARMGCVVFHYDMVGYADSKALSHDAFASVEAELRLQNLMGLQTWNSIRSLDFISQLPEVDAKRIAVTGASGGGTQTFVLCGIDDRPIAAFPAVMVSTGMQGGCVCENASYLRIGTGNVEFAALFAPKPVAMSGANDWTLEIEKKGLPELKSLYKLFSVPERVDAKCWPAFEHNYNQVAREMMYNWFNKHLGLGISGTIEEKPFTPVPPAELSVFDAKHTKPADSVDSAKLLKYLTAENDKLIEEWKPTSEAKLKEYRRVLSGALRVMTSTQPEARDVEWKMHGMPSIEGVNVKGLLLGRRGQGEQVPALLLRGKETSGNVVVWVDAGGKSSLLEKGKLSASAKTILAKGSAILAIDAYGTGELTPDKPMAINAKFAGYTFGYNRPLLAQRVHDILTAVAVAKRQDGVKTVHLLGRGKAGPWVLLARALCGDAVTRTAADAATFRFDGVRSMDDDMMLPGALKYGGLAAFTGLIAPAELLVHNHKGTTFGAWVRPAYTAAKAEEKLTRSGEQMAEDKVIEWLLK